MTTTPTAAVPSTSAPPRLHHLDAVRGAALLLGVLLHALMPFAEQVPWLVDDSRTSELPMLAVFVIHLFRMALFMMLAGYFARMVIHRRGTGAYLRDRFTRIGLPLIAFWPVVAALTVGAVVLNVTVREITALPSPAAGAAPTGILSLPTFHLWFLLLLLEILLVVVAARAVLLRVVGTERAGRWSHAIGTVLSSPAGLLLAAVPYALGLIAQAGQRGAASLHGIGEPTTLMPLAAPSIAYTGAFLTGWFLHSRPGALARLQRQWIPQLVIAAVFSVVSFLGPMTLPVPLAAAATALAGWAWVYGLLGLAARLLRGENRVVRYLADASYWIYLWHLPLLLMIEVPLADLQWPIPVKLALALVVVVGVLVLTYDLMVRSTWIGRWINGRRRPRVILTRSSPVVSP